MNSTKPPLIVYGTMIAGVVIFGTLGIFVEVWYVQGLTSAVNWLKDFPSILYPEGMRSSNNYFPKGNRIGPFVGLLIGWWFGSHVLAKRQSLATKRHQ